MSVSPREEVSLTPDRQGTPGGLEVGVEVKRWMQAAERGTNPSVNQIKSNNADLSSLV